MQQMPRGSQRGGGRGGTGGSWPRARARAAHHRGAGRPARAADAAGAHGRLPRLPAAGGVARRGRAGQGAPLRGVDLLGAAGARLRRSGRAPDPHRPGPGGARRQPDRPDVHRRPQRRVPLRRAPSGGIRQPAAERAPGRRAAAERRLHRRALQVRAAGQRPVAGGAAPLQPVARRRDLAAAQRARLARARSRRVGVVAPALCPARVRGPAAEAALRARRGRARPRGACAARQLPREPAEHEHGQAHAAHDGRGAGAGARAGAGLTQAAIRSRHAHPTQDRAAAGRGSIRGARCPGRRREACRPAFLAHHAEAGADQPGSAHPDRQRASRQRRRARRASAASDPAPGDGEPEMTPGEALELPLVKLGQLLRSRQVTAAALAEESLSRLERVGRPLNAVAALLPERARMAAAAADRELHAGKWRGPLHGVPYGAKDLLSARGAPTTWGSSLFAGRVIDEDAAVVQKLSAAGAVLVAKLSMVQLAGGFGYHRAAASLQGPGKNPWDAGRWAGGSSSGSAAAVAARCLPFALGSETWGSILTPASLCGIVGLRPTFGRVSRRGAMALAWSMDKIGPMCRGAQDALIVLAAISGPDPADPSTVEDQPKLKPGRMPGRKLRVGLVLPESMQRQDAEVYDALLAVAQAMGKVADVKRAEIPAPERPY